MKKLAIVTSHPIQYYAPLYRELAKVIDLKVFYCHQPSSEEIGKDGFAKSFEWDVDLLSGYNYEYLINHSKSPSLSSFNGCDTPQIGEKLIDFGTTHVVVFGWYLKSFIQTLRYCNKNKVPIAVRGDSVLNPSLSIIKKILKKVTYPFFLNRFDAFLHVGKKNKEYLRFYGVAENKLIFSPHAVDQQFWIDYSQKAPSGKFIFIWVGKMIALKRPFDMINAFKKAFEKDSSKELWMIGTGELMDSVREEVDVNGCANIKLLGFKNQTELLQIYNQADCLVLTSDSETWGLVVNEAMSCGLPCIVSEVCGCVPDLIDNGETGYSYHTGDISQLANQLIKVSMSDRENYSPFIKEKMEKYSFKENVNSFKYFMKEH